MVVFFFLFFKYFFFSIFYMFVVFVIVVVVVFQLFYFLIVYKLNYDGGKEMGRETERGAGREMERVRIVGERK